MDKTLDVAKIFARHAKHLEVARSVARDMHNAGDIKGAGNHIEGAVRDVFRKLLPPRYLVTHGHLIDAAGNVSPQIDFIIADQFNMPALLTGSDGTEYIPTESVLVIGEIKSTHSAGDFDQVSECLKIVKSKMLREEVENTGYGGVTGKTQLHHMVLMTPRRILNSLFSFYLAISGENFAPNRAPSSLLDTENRFLPNISVLLNKGVLLWSRFDDAVITIASYPEEELKGGYCWRFMSAGAIGEGSSEGGHLALLYERIVQHLSQSRLEPPSAADYVRKLTMFKKSSIVEIDKENGPKSLD